MPDYISEADEFYYFESYGSEEELTEDNYYVPAEEDYVSAEEVYHEESEVEEIDISIAKPGLWENIRRKKEREGKNRNQQVVQQMQKSQERWNTFEDSHHGGICFVSIE